MNVSQPYRILIFEIFQYRRIGAVSYLVSGLHSFLETKRVFGVSIFTNTGLSLFLPLSFSVSLREVSKLYIMSQVLVDIKFCFLEAIRGRIFYIIIIPPVISSEFGHF
jgi:hypothetical protein